MDKYDYVIINSDKVPQHSLGTTYSYDDVKNEENLAVMVNEPYVVLDVDDEDYFNLLCELVYDKKIRTRILKTDRGGHFWFKSKVPLQNTVNINTPITLKTDVKSWGKKSLVTVKRNGKWRNWVLNDENVDELPFWLRPIKVNKDLYNLKEGDGRDPQLFSYIMPLLNFKFTKEQIHEIFLIINEYVFADRLKDYEIEKMFTNNDVFEEGTKINFYNGNKFLHNVFADWLINTYDFKAYHNELYVYKDGIYINSIDEINRLMLEQIPSLRKNQLVEVYENLRIRKTGKDDYIDPLILNLKNGLYNLKTHMFTEHTPNVFTINRLNCSYDPEAKSNVVDYMFDSVSVYDAEVRNLLEEMVGYTLIGDCRYQKAFILLGQGANGKSKFLEMVMNMIGTYNCSTLALEDLSERFRTSQLVDKILNVGDDSGNGLLKNTAIFKKLVTGDGMTVEFKHGQPFSFMNKAKMLFSANSLPPSMDKSLGFFRRIIIIPFTATFRPGTKNYDPNIDAKLSTEESKSYLLNIGIKSAEKLLKLKTFTIPKVVSDLVRVYEMSNNNVLQWLMSGDRVIVDQTVQMVYTQYCLYCDTTNTMAVKLTKFNDEITKLKPSYYIDMFTTMDGETKQMWREVKKKETTE